jgi:perosamine synthetase
MAGATARPVDVLPESFCLDVGKMRVQASDARIAVTVHCFGASADVASLRALGVRVIEDCCQGLGGASGGLPVGAAGHAAVFSFYATKIVTGGQGGMVWAPDPGVTAAVRDFRQFDGRERYEPRFNFQMTDLQAALAHSQLGRIESIRARRHQIAAAYLAALPRGLAAQAGLLSPGRMVQRFVVVAPSAAIRDALRTQMTAAGVGCIVPVERFELLHRCLGLDPSGYAAAERLADTTLSLPLHLSLGEDEVARVCAALREFRP